ncbi:hypothetical protein M514_06983 [Trichuris suis]|uniref:Coiled-coil domain-containing protein 6 n=1 Tax=Trichuris suis TaxID=68888 RepID=A0A085M4J2_9BILA|nr:hypothetical protein M513_06983 [Trichuris suis]KFD65164.1 hypothetical protein M514_06983 [Trichuris suis]KHJ44729.1 hypothetical protein D918_04964 [Trichuris suis]
MADLSEAESDTSSTFSDSVSKPPSPATREQMTKRIDSLMQQNRVLRTEVETCKLRLKSLQEENRALKQTSVLIQAKAEQEEEFISNTLLKKIQELKKEKEALAVNYEQEEECLTNDLSRKLSQLRQEKAELAVSLQQEQESLVAKLMRKLKKLEAETAIKQQNLDQLRREKVELENTLEQEQEALVNRLWKRLDKLENEKKLLQQKLEEPLSQPPSPMDCSKSSNGRPEHSADPMAMIRDIERLRNEVCLLRQQLRTAQAEHTEKMAQLAREEQQVKEENVRLQRKLQMEVERRLQLCRHLSESESSLEMEDERHFNELSALGQIPCRSRTSSSPIPYQPIPYAACPLPSGFGGLNASTGQPPVSTYICFSQRCQHCDCILSHYCTHRSVTGPGSPGAQIPLTPPEGQAAVASSGSKVNNPKSGQFLRPALP